MVLVPNHSKIFHHLMDTAAITPNQPTSTTSTNFFNSVCKYCIFYQNKLIIFHILQNVRRIETLHQGSFLCQRKKFDTFRRLALVRDV